MHPSPKKTANGGNVRPCGSRSVPEPRTPAADKLQKKWESWLWEGEVPRLLKAARKLALRKDGKVADAVASQVGYFEKYHPRMRYSLFRRQGLFIGSGVVEAGCKSVVGQPAKQSRMCWS